MKLLLDTHVFVWADSDPARLSAPAAAAIRDPANEVWISTASAWELVIKVQVGKLTMRLPLAAIFAQQVANGMHVLPISLDHALGVQTLPPVHKDPFDRLLVAQANVEGADLVTADPIFARYPVRTFW
jgi:PIN domain nuclease of toxin-antitoxin system